MSSVLHSFLLFKILPKNCDADWLLTIAGPELFDGARKKGTESVPGGMESAWSWQEAWQGVALFSGMSSRKKDKHKRPHPDPLLEEREMTPSACGYPF